MKCLYTNTIFQAYFKLLPRKKELEAGFQLYEYVASSDNKETAHNYTIRISLGHNRN